ncbi:MAG: DUF3795 domain-containing protein [Oscillospiraceae bacterium]|jgi:hypothetical protein|nr:DUF3795 domain-containing protein [Oscillospiraceae bacterium]
MNLSSCGIDCDTCACKTSHNCPGCKAHRGKPFWGGCDLFACADGKALPHCGQCGEFPCKKLVDAHKNENPDGNGIEIANLRALINT